MSVAVIGLGAFGKWFVKQYLRYDFKIKVYDVDSRKVGGLRSPKVIGCDSIKEAVEDVEYVIIAVPINVACKVIEDVSKYMHVGTLVDISSLKRPVYNALKNLPERLRPICVHPLFGPRTSTFKNQKIAFIPVRNSLEEREIIQKLMPGARIIETTVEDHDEAMKYILSLTHLLSLAAVRILKNVKDPRSLEELAGSSFKHMCKMLDSTLTESPDTFTSIFFYNIGARELSKELLRELYEVNSLMALRDYDELREFIKNELKTYSELNFIKRVIAESYQLGNI